jgi:hypothetical protein
MPPPPDGLISPRACRITGWALFLPGCAVFFTVPGWQLAAIGAILAGACLLGRAELARGDALPCRCGDALRRHDRRREPYSCQVDGCACQGWRSV